MASLPVDFPGLAGLEEVGEVADLTARLYRPAPLPEDAIGDVGEPDGVADPTESK